MEVDDVIDGIRAVLDAEQLKYLIKRLGGSQPQEAVAVIGMACRFPGDCDTPQELGAFAQRGGNAVTTAPEARWPNAWAPRSDAEPRRGAFLRDVAGFDAAFFNIAPVDADYIDPQQRLLLEVSWEALDDAGLVRDELSGARAGVFFGLFSNDYFDLQHAGSPYCHPAAATGTQLSMAAGRLSHWLNLSGPSLVIDTACSASLVAVHLACQSLASGESDVAFAGGAQLYLTSRLHVMSSAIGMVSKSAACRVMDAGADGFVHGEGCGVLVLKRLSDALRDGDRIHAVIRGSAINHDGRTLGLTAPSAEAQERVIRRALAQAHLTADDLQYVELHGSGTPLGDPCEFDALRRVFSESRSEAPCGLGSVKTNIGHTIAAAGVAGAIRTIAAISSATLPANPWLQRVNPNVELEGTRFLIPTAPRPWPATSGPRRAGVSSFGASGTNAHVIFEQAPPPRTESAPRSRYVLLLSSPEPKSLDAVRKAWIALLTGFEGNVGDLCFTAACRRTHHRHRQAVFGANAAELARALLDSCAPVDASARRTSRLGLFLDGRAPAGDAWLPGSPGAEIVWRQIENAERLLRDEASSDVSAAISELVRAVAAQLGEAHAWRRLGVTVSVYAGRGAGALAVACLEDVVSLQQVIAAVLTDPAVTSLPSGGDEAAAEAAAFAIGVLRRIAPDWLAAHRAAEELVVSGDGTESRVSTLSSWGCPIWIGPAAQQRTGGADAERLEGARYLPSGSARALLETAAELHCLGFDVRWRDLLGEGRVVDLPRYPWQRRRHWIVPETTKTRTDPAPRPSVAPTPDAGRPSLNKLIAGVLGIDADALGSSTSLADLGITSLTATQLRDALARTYGVELSPTALWRHDTVQSLEQTLAQQLGESVMPAPQRLPQLSTLATIIGSVLGVDAESLHPQTALADLGVTSLSALELQNTVERELGVSLSATSIWRHETLGDLARTLGATDAGAERADDDALSYAPQPVTSLDDLDDAQLSALLESELTGHAGGAQ